MGFASKWSILEFWESDVRKFKYSTSDSFPLTVSHNIQNWHGYLFDFIQMFGYLHCFMVKRFMYYQELFMLTFIFPCILFAFLCIIKSPFALSKYFLVWMIVFVNKSIINSSTKITSFPFGSCLIISHNLNIGAYKQWKLYQHWLVVSLARFNPWVHEAKSKGETFLFKGWGALPSPNIGLESGLGWFSD